MENEQRWINEDGIYFPVSGDTRLLDSPGEGVFVVAKSSTSFMTRIGLRRVADRFEFDFKIYELGTEPIIKLIKKTWESSPFVDGNKNLGVIFNGIKGTGKTLSAKLLCNAIGLPVVIVQNDVEGLLPFLQSLNFECVVFIDEAEKTFKKGEDDDVLLRLIDGVYNAKRHLYILTTNQLTLNDNLLGRPGRIRYRFEFKNLLPSAIEAYLDDNLLPQYNSQRKAILDQVDLLEISTIDILKALVDEVNIHGHLPSTSCLNIPVSMHKFEILAFHYVEDYSRKDEIFSFIEKKVKESGCSSINEWILDWTSEDGEEDAEGLLSDEFSYVRKVIISASVPVLEAGCITSYGTIVESPDRNGFFLMHSVYSNDDYVCLLLKKKGSPSLYRGKLSEI